jgi:hypothetical protein
MVGGLRVLSLLGIVLRGTIILGSRNKTLDMGQGNR